MGAATPRQAVAEDMVVQGQEEAQPLQMVHCKADCLMEIAARPLRACLAEGWEVLSVHPRPSCA